MKRGIILILFSLIVIVTLCLVGSMGNVGYAEVACSTTTCVYKTNTSVPDTPVPDTPVPDTAVPPTSVPDTPIPDPPVPDTPVPDTSTPIVPIDTSVFIIDTLTPEGSGHTPQPRIWLTPTPDPTVTIDTPTVTVTSITVTDVPNKPPKDRNTPEELPHTGGGNLNFILAMGAIFLLLIVLVRFIRWSSSRSIKD